MIRSGELTNDIWKPTCCWYHLYVACMKYFPFLVSTFDADASCAQRCTWTQPAASPRASCSLNRGFLPVCIGFFLTATPRPLPVSRCRILRSSIYSGSTGSYIFRLSDSQSQRQKSLSDKARVRRTHPTLLAHSDRQLEPSLSPSVEHICVAVQSQALNNEGGRLVLFLMTCKNKRSRRLAINHNNSSEWPASSHNIFPCCVVMVVLAVTATGWMFFLLSNIHFLCRHEVVVVVHTKYQDPKYVYCVF